MSHRGRASKRVTETHRASKDEARSEGIGSSESGIELPARSYPDETGVADLGVDEPALASTSGSDSDSGVASDPTGMSAGETEAVRRDQDAGRSVLEERFPSRRGEWKESGAVPSAGQDRPE